MTDATSKIDVRRLTVGDLLIKRLVYCALYLVYLYCALYLVYLVFLVLGRSRSLSQ